MREEISVGKKQKKTNVMRILDQKKIPYTAKEYPHEEGVAVDGMTVAKSLGQEPGSVFKTLVTRGASGEYYVFDIPVAAELDLKKAAKAVGEKNVAMLHVAELLPLTGYVRGGCSPVGMRSPFSPPSTPARWNTTSSPSPLGRSASRSSCPPKPSATWWADSSQTSSSDRKPFTQNTPTGSVPVGVSF